MTNGSVPSQCGMLAMMKTRTVFLTWTLTALLFSSPSCSSGQDAQTGKAGDIPGLDSEIVTDTTIKFCPQLACLKWPTEAQVAKSEAMVVRASFIPKLALARLRTVMREEAIPRGFDSALLPLRYYARGSDVLLGRFEREGMLVRVAIGSSYIRIAMMERSPRPRGPEQEKADFIKGILRRYFNKPDLLEKSLENLVRGEGFLKGQVRPGWFDQALLATKNEHFYWYDTFEWWTDGQLVYLSACTNPGAMSGGVDQKEWFAMQLSVALGLRRGMDPLPQKMIDDIFAETRK